MKMSGNTVLIMGGTSGIGLELATRLLALGNTVIVAGHVEADIAKLPSRGVAEYGSMMREFARRAYAREMGGSAPEVVARAVCDALTATRPRIRYRVGAHSRVMTALPRILPETLLDVLRLKMFGMPVKFGAVQST